MDLNDVPSTSAKIDNLLSIGDENERKRLLDYKAMMSDNNVTSHNEEAKKKKTDDGHNDDTHKKKEKHSDEMTIDDEKEVFVLSVSNLPFQWTREQISDYIQEHCIEVYALEQLEGGSMESGQTVRLMFLNFNNCNQARKQLKLKAIDGHKLQVVFSVPEDSDSDGDTNNTLLIRRSAESSRVSTPRKPELDVWAPDPNGTYGLKLEYLESLAITPPLDKWVHVSNFRCDKSELKDVMELAGHVVLCTVVTISNRYARVMYSHPLEAVQAVSMLNGQNFYGQVLKVSMYESHNSEIILPKGLPKVGPGLGLDGRPLRDIVRQYERHLCGRYSCINTLIFEETFSTTSNNGDSHNLTEIHNERSRSNEKHIDRDPTSNRSKENIEHIDKFGPKQNGNTPQLIHHQQPNATVVQISATPPSNLSWAPSSTAIPQSFEPSRTGRVNPGPQYRIPDQHSVGPSPYVGANNPCHVNSAPMYHTPLVYNPYQVRNPTPVTNPILSNSYDWGNPSSNMGNTAPPRVSDSDRSVHGAGVHQKGTAFSMVELSNLPLSTTFPLLSEKMAQVGPVLSLVLTKPGCALVRFANPEHAERCYQHFNKMCVMGNVIDVKFV